jgi:transcriptional regulator with XRE-family HTH domain
MQPPRSHPPEHLKDWHLREWMQHANRIQADIVRDLGWERSRASKVYTGRQPYTRADVVQLSGWLGIEPYELLMPPHEALALRNLRSAAHQIVAENTAAAFEFDEPPNKAAGRHRRTGT